MTEHTFEACRDRRPSLAMPTCAVLAAECHYRRASPKNLTHEPFWTDVGIMALFGAVQGVLAGLMLALLGDSLAGFGSGFSAGDRLVLYSTCVIGAGSLGATGMAALGALLIGVSEGIAWLIRACRPGEKK